jgi:hypothetical protein
MITDATLALALVVVLLIDRVQWLRHGDLQLECAGGVPRLLAFGSPFELAGRRPWLAAPWPIDAIGFRLEWSAQPIAGVNDVIRELGTRSLAFRPLAVLSSAAAALIAVIAPLTLLTNWYRGFVVAILTTIALAAAAAVIAWRRRELLQLSRAQIVWATLIAIVCLPCAGNLARSLAAGGAQRVSLPEVVAALSGACRMRAGRDARQMLEAERLRTDEGTKAAAALAGAVARLTESGA